MEVPIKVPAIEKLLDYTASGIGSVAGSMFAAWRARREAAAKEITARGEAQVERIRAESRASTMHIIANAQSDARAILVSSESAIQGELDITDTVTQRIRFQEEKRQRNIGAIIEQAALELGDSEVTDSDPDHDWTARFFNDAPDVSSEQMQSLWAKILAGEVKRPGSTSIKTLNILRNLDHTTARLFAMLCSACITVTLDGNEVLDARVASLGGDAAQNALRKYGLSFGYLNVLNEHGLIISDFNSWRDYQTSIGVVTGSTPVSPLIPVGFQNRYWVLRSTAQRDPGKEYRLSGVALTQSGRELSRVVELEPMEEYAQALIDFFRKSNLQMTEVDTWAPQYC